MVNFLKIEITDKAIAEVTLELFKLEHVYLKTKGIGKQASAYLFNEKTTLYEEINLDQLNSLVMKVFKKYLEEFIAQETKKHFKSLKQLGDDDDIDSDDEIETDKQRKKKALLVAGQKVAMEDSFKDKKKYLEKLKQKIFNHERVKGVSKEILHELFEGSATFDTERQVINFIDLLYDTKKQTTRKRTHNDYFTKALPYEYPVNPDKSVVEEIKSKLTLTFNNDPEMYEFNMLFYAYSLTGLNNNQTFLINTGYSASNGKSTGCAFVQSSFPIYTYKLHNEMFEAGYGGRGKEYTNCMAPCRFVFIEEISTKKLDPATLKQFCDGSQITTPILYEKKSINFDPQFTLAINSNHVINFPADSGISRRGLNQVYKNQFLDEAEAKLKKGNGIFVKDKKLAEKMADEKYKKAFCYLVLSYMPTFYKLKDLSNHKFYKKLTEEFKDTCNLNDTFKQFFNERFTVTNNDEDRLGKDCIKDEYYGFTKKSKNLSDRELMSEMRRLNVVYHPKKRHAGKQGAFVGIAYKSSDDDKDEPEEKTEKKKSIDFLVEDQTKMLERKDCEINALREELQKQSEQIKQLMLMMQQQLQKPEEKKEPKKTETKKTQQKKVIKKAKKPVEESEDEMSMTESDTESDVEFDSKKNIDDMFPMDGDDEF